MSKDDKMQVLHQMPNNLKPSLPPLYIWPQSLKRIILTLAVLACLGAYLLLAGGLGGAVVLLLEMVMGM